MSAVQGFFNGLNKALEGLNEPLAWFDDNIIWGTWLLVVLLGVGILYTVISGGIQIRHFGYIFKKTFIQPVLSKAKGTDDEGAISSFQALCTAVASCVGGGNIVGVGTAILAGGPGAIFWMWVAAFVGMATKYGEIVLGLLYRQRNKEGKWVGGPFFYIEKGLHMKWLACLTAVFMILQIIGGNFIQSNNISGALASNFYVPTWVSGIALVVVIFIITLGGLKRLAAFAQRVVPVMAVFYFIGGIIIILANITNLPHAIATIFTEAFSFQAVAGGTGGYVIMMAMKKGIARGLYSNEAGEGSAPVIHSAADVEHPAQQGINGITEVFLDTFVICTVTGLAIIISGIPLDGTIEGNQLAIQSFASLWGPLRYVVALSLIMFCLTTLMSQWYFGYVGLDYLFGDKVADKFKYVFPFFCIIGAIASIDLVWTIQDIALGLLTIPNLIAMVVLFPQVKKATKEYFGNPKYFTK